MLFLDLCLFFGGERVSEGEVEVGFDELLVRAKERAQSSTDGVAEAGYEARRKKGEDSDGDSVEVVGEVLHHRFFQWMKRRGCSSSRLGVMPASLLAS